MPIRPSSHRALLLVPAAALLAVLPLILHGCSCGHDLDFHLLSWFEAATQIAHGNLHPHWAFTPAYNAGEPRFVFYPPLSWYTGALLGLLMPWAWTPIAYTWLALTAAGLSCHSLLRDFAPPATALLVAALYTVNPYMLFTAYERTAYAELLAAAWLPLLLHAILRERVAVHRIALPVALLWLTNAPAAVLACYGLALLTLVRLIQNWLTARVPHPLRALAQRVGDHYSNPIDKKPPPLAIAFNTLAGTALGLGLAAFYILPAAYQQRYVEVALAKAPGLLATDNFLFHHTADPSHDAVLHTASLLATGLLLATAVALLIAYRRNRPARPTLIPLAALTAAIALLLTPLSTPIWLHAPELAFLQFPWRFLALLTPALALALALAIDTRRFPSAGLMPVLLLAFAAYFAFHYECDPEDTPAARLALFHSPLGTEPTDEYTPNTLSEDSLSHTNPPFWLAANPNAPAPPNAPQAPLRWPLDLTLPKPEVLILNLRSYPAWRITRNRQILPDRLERPDGLIALPLPAGASHLDLAYATTPDQTIGWALSALSLAALLFALRRHPR